MFEALRDRYDEWDARAQERWAAQNPRVVFPFWIKLILSYLLISALLGGLLLVIWPAAQAVVEGQATAKQVRAVAVLGSRAFDLEALSRIGHSVEDRSKATLCKQFSDMVLGASGSDAEKGEEIYRYHVSVVIPRGEKWIHWISSDTALVDTEFEYSRFLRHYLADGGGWDNAQSKDEAIHLLTNEGAIRARDQRLAATPPGEAPPLGGVAMDREPIVSVRSLADRVRDYTPDFGGLAAVEPGIEHAALVVEAPPERVRNLTDTFLWVLILIFVGTSLIVLVISLLMTWRINRPIRALHDAMLAAGEGDLTCKVEGVRARDEFGRLAWQFNRMLDEIGRNQALAAEVDVASRIQRELIPPPPTRIPRLDIAAWYSTCQQVGGDYYDFIQHEGELWVSVGDAVGHGIDSGMIMATARAMVRALLEGGMSPGAAMTRLNSLLGGDLRGGNFLTCVLCCIKPAELEAVFCSAGHEPVVHYRAADKRASLILRNGPPLGLRQDLQYPESRIVRLEPGDVLLFSTDGVRECHSPTSELFGKERLLASASQGSATAEEVLDHLKRELETFAGGEELKDDISVVVVRVRE